MKIPYLTSFGARRTKDGSGRKAAWLMGTLAVLFAVLAVAVPLQESASAQTPEPSISLTVSDVKFETATVDITVTNVNSTNIPSLNWKVNVVFKTDAYEHPHKNAGPTHTVSQGQESYSFDYDVQGSTVTADVDLNWLIPASEYTVEVKLCDTDCGIRNVKAEASTTFSTKSGCTPHPTNRGKWFPGYHFTKVTENELIVRVHVNNSYAPLDSGRCVYYTYNTYFENDYSEIRTAYIRHIGSGGRTAQIELTGLEPGTRYGYHITLDVEAEDNAAGFSGSTLGPNTGISDIVFTNITNDSAKATATVKNASTDDKFVYWRYRESPLDGDPGIWLTLDKVSTKTSTADKDFNYLDAGTRYEVEASVKDNFNLGMSMTRAFVTLPGKPGISPLEAGDGSLKVTWTAPTEGAATITGYRVQWQETEERFTSEFPPPTLTLDDADVNEDDTSYTITGLTNGTEYIVHVIAKNESGGTSSDDAFGTPMGIPNAPNNLQVAEGNEKLTLTWEEPTAKEGVTITDYVVEYKENAAQNWTSSNAAIQTITDTQTYRTIIPDLTNDTLYDVQVRADNGVTSDNYEWATGSGTPVPDPSIRTVTVDLNSVTQTEATATVTIDRANDSTQTILLQHRTLPSGGWSTPAITDTTATGSKNIRITGLTGNTEYEVQAWLQTDVNNKVKSDEFTTAPVVPAAPSVSVTSGDKKLTLTWNEPDNGGDSITGYIVQWKSGSDTYDDAATNNRQASVTTLTPPITYEITGLLNGTTYDVRVRAVNTAEPEAGQDYNWGTGSDKPRTIPAAPNVSVTPGNAKLDVAWTKPDDGGDAITGFIVQYKKTTDTGWTATTPPQLGANTLETTISSLENGTLHHVRVRAVNSVTKQNEDDYNWATGSETPKAIPDPPTVSVTVGDEELEVSWNEPDDGGDAITGFIVQYKKGTDTTWTSLTQFSASTLETTISILDNGETYMVRVRAVNSITLQNEEDYNWGTGSGTPRTIPTEPTVTVTPDNARLHVSWNKPDDGGEEITGFVVQYKKDVDSAWNTHANPGSNTVETTIPDLENGTLYDVRVRAVNTATEANEDDYNWGTGSGKPRTIPAEPTVTVTSGNAELEVSWNKPGDGGDDITGFIVQYKKNTDVNWTELSPFDDSDLETTISSLENGETYLVRVRAVNSVVLDDEKDYNWGTGSGKPITIPGLPTVSVTPGNAELSVTWNKPGNGGDTITGFVVQYMKDTDTSWSATTPPQLSASTLETTLSGLDNGDMYMVRVRAVNTVVLDDEDDYNWGTGSGKPKTIPNAPDSLVVTHGDKTLNATWEAPAVEDNGGDAVTAYEVQWKEKSSTGWSSRSTEDVSGAATLELDISTHLGQPLANGTLYEVRVRAVNTVEKDDEEDYNWVYGEETPSTPPGAPDTIRISNQGNAELTVAWSAPSEKGGSDITGYVVQWKEKATSGWTTSVSEEEINSANTFTHTFDEHSSQALVNGTMYVVRVIAKNRNDRGTPSTEVEGKPRTTPNAPTNVQVVEGDAQLVLTWIAPTETGGTDIDYYFVEYKKDGEANFASKQTDNDTEGYTLKELENGKIYIIQVKSHTDGGTSEPSGQATGKPRTTPGPPTITGITEGNRILTVAWTAPTVTGGDDPTKYVLEWEEWNGTSWVASDSAEDDRSPYEIDSLTNGTKYRVVVKAVNAAGTGAASEPKEGTPRTIPDAPTASVTAGDKQLKVTWDKPGDGGDEITGFIVQYRKNTDANWSELSPLGASVLETTISGLNNGDTYTVRVRAVNSVVLDNENDYNWGTGSDKPKTIPDPPTVSVTAGNAKLDVAWNKPANGGDDITGFIVQYKKDTDPDWSELNQFGANDLETTISSLDNGVTYLVRVRAVNSVVLDNEDDYNWGTGDEIPRTVPEAPTNLKVIVGDEELTLSWEAPAPEDNGGAAIEQYVLQWKSGMEEYDSESSRQATTDLLSKVIDDLSNGTLYSIRVRADNGEKADSYKWVEKTGMPMSVPGAPTMLRVDQGDRQLIVSWTAPEDTGGIDIVIDHFVIQWQVSGGNWSSPDEHETTDGTDLTDTITGLLNGTDYDIRVRADNDVTGQTFQWAYTTGKPRTIPGPPRSLRVTAGDGQLALSWAAPSDKGGLDINQYIVQWKSGIQEYDTSRQATPTTTSQVIGQLTNDTPHFVRVRADNGEEADSYNWAPGNGTPAAAQSPPAYNPPPPQQSNPPPQRSPVNPTPPVIKSPEIASVSVTNETQTSADATVNIDDAGTAQNTVNLRYSVDGENSWTDHTKTETGSTVEFPLSSLTAGTAYEVEAWLGSDTDNKVTATFMTTQAVAVTPPSISSVSVTNETQTSADATVNIDDAGTAQNTVNLRYSVDGENSWTDHTKTETGSTVEFPLSSLTAGTAYEVEAWLGSDTDNKVTATFMTTQAVAVTPPSISSVSVTNETQTSADATVNIDDAGTAQNTVNLRYSVDGENSWTDHTKTETGSTVEFPLSSLTAGTAYEVEAWLGSDTDNKVTATFMTTQAVAVTPPSISSVSVTNETQTSTDATVNIDDAGTAQNTVNLRYSVDGENSWTDHTKTETGSTVEFPLSSLTAGTTYEVEAWLGSDTDNKVTATFTTIQAAAVTPPSISSVRVLNIAQTNARVVVGLANANAEQRVYMKYKLSSAQWPTTSPQNTTHTNGSATFILSSLTAGTEYHVRVSLNSGMSDATTRSFTTTSPITPRNPTPPRSPVVPPPSVSSVTFDNEAQTSADATVNIANPGTAKKTVRLQYRVDGTTAWSTPPKSENTSGSSATFAMTNLTAATTYEVQAWLNTNSPPSGAQIYTFTTLANDPGISNLKMENIRQTSATAMVKIADAGTEMKEVYLKHSIDGADEWAQIPFPTITYSDSTSIDLTGLEEQTTYQVMVDLTDGFDKPKGSTFTTLAAPSLSGVSISSITQTGAVATATIADAGTAQKTVYLRFREFGESQWSTAQAKTTTDASAAFNLTGLGPRTTYEVQASLDIEFGTSKYAVFTTLSPDPSVSGVSVGSITQTSATATMTIVYPGIARKTVRLRYRVSGETEWGAVQTKVTRGGSAAIDLTGLSPRTTYEVEASLSSDFAGSKTATFSTLSLDPSVSGVSIGSITQTSAVGAVTIANPGTAQKTVHLQYRVDGASEWSDSALTATTDGPSATIYMTGLVANTEYEVRASLASDFALAQHATFTTLRYPSISDVDVTDVTKNTATAEIDIADPDGSSQTVHLRYRTTTPQGTWSSTFTTASATGEASIDLTGLTVDTEYEVEASLAADFAIAVSDIFRTQPPDPVVAEVSVNSILQTAATASIDIANANGIIQKVSLRYRTTTPRGNWSNIQTTTSTTGSASIDLTELTPGTEYDVQASLENSFPSSRTKHDTFSTLRWPSIASFEAENVARNGATVSATIADSRGVAQTVYVRHRATGYIAWRPTQQMDSVDDIASLRLRGLSSGTEYTAEASLDNSFPDGGTRSVTFTTKERDDEDAVDSDIAISTTRTTNVPLLGFTPQMLRFVAIEGGDNPAPQAFSVWNRAHGSMSFNLSNHEEWLSQQPMSGVSNGPDDPVTITASVDSSELASGQYVDVINIDVTSSGKSPGQIIVILDVLPPDYIRQFVSRDEGGVVILPDGTVKLIVQPLSPPKDVDIELMKLNLQAHGQPPGEQERVVVAIESNTYEPGGDTPEDVAYAPYLELWVQLPQEDAAACDENRTRVYSVQSGDWSLIEHRCETDEAGNVWAVTQVERLGQFALAIDDAPVSPTPTPVAAAVAATATAIPASAPAVAAQRISLPAQPPTPVPTSVPTAVPMPNGKTTVAPAMAPTSTPTPTAVPAGNEPSAPMMQASAGDGGSGGFGRIILAALGVPMLIGALIVVYLLYKERRRRDDARL